jgi:uncharacterized protein (TIGR03086 family)
MSQNLRRYVQALYTLDAVTRRVPADAWDQQSCCGDWTAREVAGHASLVIGNVGAMTGNMAAPEAKPEAELAGDDPASVLASAVANTIAALDHQGALNAVTATPFGEMSIDSFLGTIWIDPLTHAWDIADATGGAHGIDDDTADAAYAALEPLSEALRAPGRFNDVIEDDSSPVARFVGFTGRASVQG